MHSFPPGELPTGDPEEVAALLHRYLTAERKGESVSLQAATHAAAQRLEQQAVWRREFGTVTLVSGA